MTDAAAGQPSVTETNLTRSVDADDDIDLQSVAESEIPEVRREAQDWLVANNVSDQRAIAVFACGILVFAVAYRSGWAAVLAGCIALVIPFRWMAAPYFRRGDLRRGILWANLGSWYLLFPLVLIVPETLPIAMQNVIGPVVLAATYLDRRFVRRLVPVTVVIAVTITYIAFTSDGVGLDELIPRPVFLGVLLVYVGANLLLVMGDIQELNLVHLRGLQRAVRQNRQLRAAEQALRDSRRRLLVAADDERVRLERDLHDGAQQRLVSLSLQLRLAAELAEEGRAASSELLMAMHRDATGAIEELRDLAQGVYPSRLHELGLARALHAVARRSSARIDIRDSSTSGIDGSTKVALYFVCVEAIQNAIKHGNADTTITISMTEEDGDFVLAVVDDGPGFDIDERTDSRGLLNMSDRVGAIGGDLVIRSDIGTGTTVTAHVPLAVGVGDPA
jgi:signal transduction histidine kinase